MNNTQLKEKIFEFARSQSITEAGVAPCGEGCALVFLFPYFCGEHKDRNISLYACAPDYHKVVMGYLEKIEEYIRGLCPDARTKCYADIGPERDKSLALLAGLGVKGENTLLINKKYGSFVFVGYIETDLDLPCDAPLDETCLKCGACKAACPGGALGDTNDFEKCASHISQKRGELTQIEREILLKSHLAWGCDACQLACPMNKGAEYTPLDEFKQDHIYRLEYGELCALSNSEFREKYKNRAFVWRGKKIICRNLKLIEKGL